MTEVAHPDSSDPLRAIKVATERHRADHKCWAYPHSDGRLLSVLVAAVSAKRILELGTALGYSALSLANGAADAHVDTLERDPLHVALARENILEAGLEDRVIVHQGEFETLLPGLQPSYDVAFFDGYAPSLAELMQLQVLLRPGGLLISANQQHAGPGAEGYRAHLLDRRHWLSAPLGESADMTLSVRSTRELHPKATHEPK